MPLCNLPLLCLETTILPAVAQYRAASRSGRRSGKGGALAGGAFNDDGAPHGDNQLVPQPQTHPKSTVFTPGHGPLEALENAGTVFPRDADALVTNNELRHLMVGAQSNGNGVAGTEL